MLANLDRQKFIEMLGKLGSEKDEDALSAARDLHAQVTVAQLSWDDLLVPDQLMRRGGDDGKDDDGDYEDEDNLFDEDDEKDITDEENLKVVSDRQNHRLGNLKGTGKRNLRNINRTSTMASLPDGP